MVFSNRYIKLLSLANRSLVAVIVVVALYFGAHIFKVVKSSSKQGFDNQEELEKSIMLDILGPKIEHKSAFYSKKRIFFGESKKRRVLSPVRKHSENKFLKELVLVGIFGGDDAKAVIDNTKTKESYYLSIGDVVDGACKLAKINKKSVIIKCHDVEHELTF